MRVLLRRSLVHADQLLAVLLLIALGTGALAVLVATLAAGIDRGVDTVLRDAEPTAGALRVQTALDPDGAAQDERYRASLPDAIDDAPLRLVRSVRSDPAAARIDGRPASVVLGSQEHLDELAELVDGAWPASDTEASLPEAAAIALGVSTGDAIAVAGRDYVVVGIWRAHDPAAPVWFSETLIASGRLGDAAGPVMIDEATLETVTPRAAVAWTLVPDAEIATADVPGLVPVESRVRAAADRLGTGRYAVTTSGGLSHTAERVDAAVTTARGLGGVAIAILLAATAIAVGLVARSLAQVRQGETALVESRGSSRGRLAVWAAAEALVVAVVGAAIGVGSALVFGAAGVTAAPDAGVLALAASVGVVGGAATAAISARSDSLGVARAPRASRSRRSRPVAETESIAPALVATVLAGLALAASATGSAAAGPVSLVAPALALVAGVLLVRLLVAPALRVAELIAARRLGLLPVLPLRQLGRRPRAVASAFLIVALASGAVVFAALAGAAQLRTDAASVDAEVGADVRIVFSGTGRSPASASPYTGLAAVGSASEVALLDATLGGVPAQLLLADDDLAEVVPTAPAVPGAVDGRPGAVLTPALAAALGASVGDALSVDLGIVREPVVVTVAEVAPLPGTGQAGLLVGVRPFADAIPTDARPPASEVWIGASDPTQAAVEARAATTRPAVVVTATSVSNRAISDVGAAVATAAAAVVVVVAWAGFAAAAVALGRLRRGELLPLRSMGVGPRSQGRARTVELAVTGVAALVGGAAVGALAARLAVSGPFGIDALLAPASLILLAGCGVAVATVAWAAGIAVGRAAARAGSVR